MLLLAEKTFNLYRNILMQVFFRNTYYNNVVRPEKVDEDEYYNEETIITMDKYISLFSQKSDGLFMTILWIVLIMNLMNTWKRRNR